MQFARIMLTVGVLTKQTQSLNTYFDLKHPKDECILNIINISICIIIS